jgi:glycerol-3-phosphate dehydrogenase
METPEQVASHFMDAMRSGDWHTMAALMHRDALSEMRRLLAALFEAPKADAFRQQLLGVNTVAAAQALSDTAVFASLMRATTQGNAGLADVLRSAKVQMLGHIDEGSDTTHVVYRMAMSIDGMSITRMDVMSLSRSANGWRGLLKGDVSALAAGIRAAIERQ